MSGDLGSGKAALRVPGKFGNSAVGRFRARPNLQGVIAETTLSSQEDACLADHGGDSPPDASYVSWISANDLPDILLSVDLWLLNMPCTKWRGRLRSCGPEVLTVTAC
ncbi:MAG: hypothetical protein H7A04_06710 [Pseudomonadales bacterium]|nr:hypothetical protein [Pseudomonadales bacterium]